MQKLTRTERTTLALVVFLVGVMGYIIGNSHDKGTAEPDAQQVAGALVAHCVQVRGLEPNECAQDIAAAIGGRAGE